MGKNTKQASDKRNPHIIITVFIIICGFLGGSFFLIKKISAGGTASFKSVCEKDDMHYTDLCNNVGKYAHTLYSVDPVNDRVYGKITGVAWRHVGNIISRPNEVRRYAPGNNYYYIVCPDHTPSYCMLQHNEEVRAVGG